MLNHKVNPLELLNICCYHAMVFFSDLELQTHFFLAICFSRGKELQVLSFISYKLVTDQK